MAGSRDVLKAFITHIDTRVAAGNVDAARRAWADFSDNVVPSFGERHHTDAQSRRAEIDRDHGNRPEPNG